MAFATSAMQLSDYRTEATAEVFGGSSGYGGLDPGEAAEIDRLIKRAERTFWSHPPVDPPHVWSCLRDPGVMNLWTDREGATELIVNGSFIGALADGWTLGVGWSVTTAAATATGAISTDLSQTVAPLTVGSTYTLTYRVTRTAGSITPKFGTTSGTARSSSGTFTESVACAGTGAFKFTGAGFTGTVDSVSVVLTSSIPGSGTTVSQDSAGTTITASANTFFRTMVGSEIVVYGGGTYLITAYISPTAVTVDAVAGTTYAGKAFSMVANGIYPLPTDFDSPESSTIEFTDNSYVPAVQLMNEKYVTGLRATQAQTGYPQFAAIRWKTSDGTVGQSQELVTWPTADQDYEVSLPYMVQPQVMNLSTDYPRGGPEMADCLLSVMLAVCEEAKSGRRGDRWAEATLKCNIAAKRDRTRHHNFIAGWMRPDSGSASRMFDVKRLVLPA